jgi:CheY-like chemotaxis protein
MKNLMKAPHILIVDENIAWLLKARSYLESKGYFTVVKDDARKAVQYLKSQPEGVDVILTDIDNSDLNGAEFLTLLKKEGLSSIPVILEGENSDNDDIEEAVELGAVAFLTKPYQDKHLIDTVEKILKKSGKHIAILPHKPEEALV